jgi:hypothetical protein
MPGCLGQPLRGNRRRVRPRHPLRRASEPEDDAEADAIVAELVESAIGLSDWIYEAESQRDKFPPGEAEQHSLEHILDHCAKAIHYMGVVKARKHKLTDGRA